MKEFARECYSSFIYCNFDKQEDLKSIFESTKDPFEIIESLSIIFHLKIEEGKTLIILDEIQDCPEALGALKYFAEEANGFHIISAGSLLGTMIADGMSYPVGKVNIIDIYPMSYGEFLDSVDSTLHEYYIGIEKGTIVPEAFHKRLLRFFDDYLIGGGMPEAVNEWNTSHSYELVRAVHNEILSLYENDIAKHASKIDSGRILEVYNSIASQLARENGKFIYGAINSSAREYSVALQRLCASGIAIRVYNLTNIEYPLNAYRQLDHFKLYFLDVGLLASMAAIDPSAIILGRDFFYKGALAKNFVLSGLAYSNVDSIFYYSASNIEVDFIIQIEGNIIPIEVKSGLSLNSKSFASLMKKKALDLGIKLSRQGLEIHDNVLNIPLYLAERIDAFIN